MNDDHIVDANKMATPRRLDRNQPCGCVVCVCEDEVQCLGCGASHCGTHPVGQIPNPVYDDAIPDASFASQLLDVVNDRNRLGVQLDLVRDELQRIWARVMESGHADHPSLSSIKVYCERAQKDIEVNYTPIQERDKLSRELSAASAEIARLKAGGCARDQRTTQWCAEAVEMAQKLDAANARIAELEREADERAFSLSPEMVQARNDQLSQRVAELEQWIRGLEKIPGADDVTQLFGDEWPFDGKCAYVGPQKPDGLR